MLSLIGPRTVSPIRTTRQLILSQPAVAAALLIAFVMIVGTALIALRASRGLAASRDRAFDTQRTLVAVNRLIGTVEEIEAAQRTPAFTSGNASEYVAARAEVHAEVNELRRQVTDNPNQLALVAELQRSLTQRFTPAGVPTVADGLVASAADLRRLLREIQDSEIAQFANEATIATERMKNFQRLNIGLIVLATVLAIAGAAAIVRRLHALEDFITVCAWTRRVQLENRWVSFEEYLLKRFQLRCSHGICEEAADQMIKGRHPAAAPPAPENRIHLR